MAMRMEESCYHLSVPEDDSKKSSFLGGDLIKEKLENAQNRSILPEHEILQKVHQDSSSSSTLSSLSTTSRTTSLSPERSGTKFDRWRPQYHFIAPFGWMNDPCAPGYNPETGLYHLGFQWNPHDHVWGNMSWGSATSTDFVKWNISKTASMEPNRSIDSAGVFTGCMLPTPICASSSRKWKDSGAQISASGKTIAGMVAFYTAAQRLPISYKIPYIPGSEKLYTATSSDHGRHWSRSTNSLVLSGPPPELASSVTGWRDPYVCSWNAMDRLLGFSENEGLYGILSGGIRNVSPTIFLYRIDETCITKWKFLGTLISLGLNYSRSRWSGDFGVNWEVANFIELTDPEGVVHNILVTSVEGVPSPETERRNELITEHQQMWLCGSLHKSVAGGVRMQYKFGGKLDHGCFYAANGFHDPILGKFVTIGWIMEADLSDELVKEQTWSGCLSVPRILEMTILKDVVGALNTRIDDIDCIEAVRSNDGTYTLRILNITPDPRLTVLRQKQILITTYAGSKILAIRLGRHWEFHGSFEIGTQTQLLGLEIAHDQNFETSTSIRFLASAETIIIDRSKSTAIDGVNMAPESAPHTLFTFQQNGCRHRETLDLHVYFDSSVLEVFVNRRTVITTRIYSDSQDCFGMRWFTDKSEGRKDVTIGDHEHSSNISQARMNEEPSQAKHESQLIQASLWMLGERER